MTRDVWVLICCAAIAIGSCSAEAQGPAGGIIPQSVYRPVMCPPDWRVQVAQRYDTRNRRGEIVKSVWIRKCL